MTEIIEFPALGSKMSHITPDEVRAIFGWDMTDEQVVSKQNELADFCSVLVTLAQESICQRP